jgi:hypothetical protein
MHYGYVGMAACFTPDELLHGAVLAQFIDDFLDPDSSPSATPGVTGLRKYDPQFDQAAIQVGIDLWNTFGLDRTPNAIIHVIESNPYLNKRKAHN